VGHLIIVAARISRHGRGHITLHPPERWHREQERLNLFETAWGLPYWGPDQSGTGHRARTAPAATRKAAGSGIRHAAERSAARLTCPDDTKITVGKAITRKTITRICAED
jgi:hypothetical protein